MHSELADMKQTLELERDICDRLEEQINDLTELHQHEMSELKLVTALSLFQLNVEMSVKFHVLRTVLK